MVRTRCCVQTPQLGGGQRAEDRRGESPARHSTSSAMRLPTPARRDWSSSRALSGAWDPRSAPASWPGVRERASGPRWERSGSSEMPPRRRGSWTTSEPPSSNRRDQRSQAGSRRRGRVVHLTDAAPTVDEQVAGHAEADAHRQAGVHVQQQQLPDPPGGHQPVSDQQAAERPSGGRPLQVPGVGAGGGRDGATQGGLGQPAVALDLGKLGHRGEGSQTGPGPPAALARVGPCPPRSRNGPSCSPKWSPPDCAPAVPRCVVACPYDVLSYDDTGGRYKPFHIDAEGGPDDCTHGVKGCTMCTRACPRFRLWEPEIDTHLFGRERTDEEVAGVSSDTLLVRATDPEILELGQDGGLVSALLIWALEHDLIDAALVSVLEGDGSTWKAVPGSPPAGPRSWPQPVPVTPTRPILWPTPRPSKPAPSASPSWAWDARPRPPR